MPSSAERRAAQGQLARLTKLYGPDDARTVDARRRFNDARAAEIVATLPPFTEAGRRKIERLIISMPLSDAETATPV